MKTSERNNLTQQALDAPKVLVTDDDEATRILLRMALAQWGYQVVEAGDGEEAWKILQQPDPPQILTLDWLMPKLDGISLCKKIEKELSFRPYIIFLTRMAGTENMIQGLEAGADEFILKPFNLAELRIRIFAGERIIKYRNQLAEQNKQLQDYVSNMKSLATEHAKEIIPFSDLIALLQNACHTLNEVNEKLLEDKENNINPIEKIKELHGKLNNMIDIIKNLFSGAKIIPAVTQHKKPTSPVPAELIIQEGESIINMQRMYAFFGKDNLAIQDFIKTFISLSSNQITEIGTAIKNQDSKAAKYFFHLLGSASGNSGMMKMYELCGKGEESVLKSDWINADVCYQALKKMIEKLRVELEQFKK